MPAVERMTITMPAEMAETLRQTVAGGEYASTSEVVREALRDWTRRRDGERQDLETLRAAIKAGLDSGPGIPADQVFAELRALRRQDLTVPRLVILPAARVDLTEIGDFIALDNPERAASFVTEIEAKMVQAAEHPESFPRGTTCMKGCGQPGMDAT